MKIGWPRRCTRFARYYDAVSADPPVYRVGRVAAIEGLRLRSGDHVLDVGCGTGLNFPVLRRAVGTAGCIVGVDASGQMLEQARRRVRAHGWDNIVLVRADATTITLGRLAGYLPSSHGGQSLFDAALATYVLSLIPDWPAAWCALLRAVGPAGRIAVADMQ